MGRSAGPGSPVWFVCHVARRTRMWPDPYPDGHDKIVRTGRTKTYRPPSYSALGSRSLTESHEYRCECGHVGWTNHRDILRFPVETPCS